MIVEGGRVDEIDNLSFILFDLREATSIMGAERWRSA